MTVLRVAGYVLLALAPSVIALALFLAAARAGTRGCVRLAAAAGIPVKEHTL